MGRCPISKMSFVDLQVIFLHFYPGIQLQYFTWKCYQWCWIIPYTISRATCTPAPLSVAIIKTCEAGLVLSVTRILEPHCPNSVCICYRHIVKPGIMRNDWTFQTLREITNSLSRFMKWLKSLGISSNDLNLDVQITLSAWTGLDNKRNDLESTVINSPSLLTAGPASTCWLTVTA